MQRIAALLPAEYRGHYQEATPDLAKTNSAPAEAETLEA